eukprot:gene11631-biopygen9432
MSRRGAEHRSASLTHGGRGDKKGFNMGCARADVWRATRAHPTITWQFWPCRRQRSRPKPGWAGGPPIPLRHSPCTPRATEERRPPDPLFYEDGWRRGRRKCTKTCLSPVRMSNLQFFNAEGQAIDRPIITTCRWELKENDHVGGGVGGSLFQPQRVPLESTCPVPASRNLLH